MMANQSQEALQELNHIEFKIVLGGFINLLFVRWPGGTAADGLRK